MPYRHSSRRFGRRSTGRRSTGRRVLPTLLAAAALAAPYAPAALSPARAEFPTPSAYPVSWQFDFEADPLRRIVVNVPGERQPQAYYYLTYTVTNDTDRERPFLPVFTLVTREGRAIRSDQSVPYKVFDSVKQRLRDAGLQDFVGVAGDLRVGEDQQKRGVAIWPAPLREMGSFQVYVEGLSGETANPTNPDGSTLAGPDGRPITLRKALQLDYTVYGDEVNPQNDRIVKQGQTFVMR